MTQSVCVNEMMADVLDGQRCYLVEKAVDEYLAAEQDLLSEATTAADKMVDLAIEDTPEDIEIDDFIDSYIEEDIEGEDDLLQDTMEEEGLYDKKDLVEDIEDVVDPDEFLDNDCIDELID